MPARYAPGAGSIQFWLWPARTVQFTSQGFVYLQNSVCFNWTVLTQKSRTCYPIAYARAISMFSTGWHLSARGTRVCTLFVYQVTSRNGPGFFVRSFEFLGTGLYISRGKILCKPHFIWVIWTILAKNGTLLEVLKILEVTEKWKFCVLNYHRMRKCKSLRKSHVRCCSLVD